MVVPVIYSTTQGTSYQQSVQILEKKRGGQGGVMSAAPIGIGKVLLLQV
jgi:hypothetical protein